MPLGDNSSALITSGATTTASPTRYGPPPGIVLADLVSIRPVSDVSFSDLYLELFIRMHSSMQYHVWS